MPNRIRLIALVANGLLCLAFAVMALAILGTGQPVMVALFGFIAATAGFSWYVIRKAARVLAEEEWRRIDLQQQLAGLRPATHAQPPMDHQGPTP